MRFPGARKFAAVAVPFALVAGGIAVTAAPAYATRDCTTNTMLLAQAQAAENEGDGWVYIEEDDIDEGNYAEANYAYIKAGIAFKLADQLYAAACA
jgi:hypothetical protein